MINCIIIDDEQHSIDILAHYAGKTSYLNLVASTTNPLEGLELINSGNIDLAFLDVQMPEISGIEITEAINGKCKVILTTAYEQYALQGYDLNVVDFLLKPISLARFLQAVEKVTALRLQNTNAKQIEEPGVDFIYVRTGLKNTVVKIVLDEIDYIESEKNYAMIHHNEKRTMVCISMKDLETKLPETKFLRVHKSFIVPYAKIEGVEGTQIILKDLKTSIQLGDTYRAFFWNKIKSKTIGS